MLAVSVRPSGPERRCPNADTVPGRRERVPRTSRGRLGELDSDGPKGKAGDERLEPQGCLGAAALADWRGASAVRFYLGR